MSHFDGNVVDRADHYLVQGLPDVERGEQKDEEQPEKPYEGVEPDGRRLLVAEALGAGLALLVDDAILVPVQNQRG